MRASTCEAIGCIASIPRTEVFCTRHKAMLERDVLRLIGQTFKPGKKASVRFASALDHARREIFYVQTHGEHMPRDRFFEFDDKGDRS